MPDLALAGVRYATHPDVYEPSDDTFLLLETIDPGRGERFLDVGCGAGLVGIGAARRGARVLATDPNPQALRLSRENAARNGVRIEVVRADLLGGLRPSSFDAIAFNPPYLPTRPAERLSGPLNGAFDGGPTGRSVLQRFLRGLARDPPARTWIVVSSLQGPVNVDETLRRHGFRGRVRATKKLSFERLSIFELSPPPEAPAR